PLPGATNATLSLIEVEPADAGVYKLAVSNVFGVAYGPAIPLLVPPALNPAAVLDAEPLAFALRDKPSWLADSNVVRVGAASLSSGVVGHGEAASLVTYLRGPGELRFWWRVSSEPGFDRFECWLGGTRAGVISGEQAWQEVALS
ncbi:MAG TPA: hypothetical protein PKC18_19140, partial [Lacipirellulaceae bacterium]|nr:hypothetical protein [Lacipirellulaceae bacterium]